MPRRPLLLALCVSPAIAIKCDKCTDRECFETCYYLQKVRSTEAKYKCCSASDSADGVDRDGSAAGVDQCFLDGGDCASCCGACTITTDLGDYIKRPKKKSCVCYEASATNHEPFYGTNNNDCVFIEADDVKNILVRNQCLEGARRKCSPSCGEEVDARDALRACGRDSDLISPTS